MKQYVLLTVFALVPVFPVAGQTALLRGDVVVSADEDVLDDNGFPIAVRSNLRVYGRDGVYKRELVGPEDVFGEPLVLGGVVFFGSRSAIERVAADGTPLPPFTTNAVNVNYLASGPAGGILAVNNSGEIYRFAADGTLVSFRDFTHEFPAFGGLDLARDGCTVFYGLSGALLRWNVCTATDPILLNSSLGGASYALRILPDGSILQVVLTDAGSVFHLDREGNVLREYSIPSPHAVALDIDGTSFWTNAGNLLVRIDIATGAVLSETFTPYQIYGISVVGEPRAALAATQPIPALSPLGLAALAVAIAVVAALTLRAN
jgi:hypothetical protein